MVNDFLLAENVETVAVVVVLVKFLEVVGVDSDLVVGALGVEFDALNGDVVDSGGELVIVHVFKEVGVAFQEKEPFADDSLVLQKQPLVEVIGVSADDDASEMLFRFDKCTENGLVHDVIFQPGNILHFAQFDLVFEHFFRLNQLVVKNVSQLRGHFMSLLSLGPCDED